MADTAEVYAHIDAKLKEEAEDILAQLGISHSSAIQMFYCRIVQARGIPFDLRPPRPKPAARGGMARGEMRKKKRAAAESLFGIIPPEITLEEAREERLNRI